MTSVNKVFWYCFFSFVYLSITSSGRKQREDISATEEYTVNKITVGFNKKGVLLIYFYLLLFVQEAAEWFGAINVIQIFF